jgi:hypothetical protein
MMERDEPDWREVNVNTLGVNGRRGGRRVADRVVGLQLIVGNMPAPHDAAGVPVQRNNLEPFRSRVESSEEDVKVPPNW